MNKKSPAEEKLMGTKYLFRRTKMSTGKNSGRVTHSESTTSRCPSLGWDEAVHLGKRNNETVVPTFCGMCGPLMSCGIYAFVKNGKFIRVAGMKESPVNKGGLCPKGQAAPQWVYSPDRLKTPLKRVGEKGEGKFREITWDEAISTVADTLKRQKEKFGPESLAILSPANRSYSDYMSRFLNIHGSPNYAHSGICALQRAFAFFYTVGNWPRPEYEKSDLIIYWGRQPIFSGHPWKVPGP
jgi:anaerobic selenocysteine-containing dehydrogenase